MPYEHYKSLALQHRAGTDINAGSRTFRGSRNARIIHLCMLSAPKSAGRTLRRKNSGYVLSLYARAFCCSRAQSVLILIFFVEILLLLLFFVACARWRIYDRSKGYKEHHCFNVGYGHLPSPFVIVFFYPPFRELHV